MSIQLSVFFKKKLMSNEIVIITYFCDLVDWYAQIAREDARTVQIVPPKASQKAMPNSQFPLKTNG